MRWTRTTLVTLAASTLLVDARVAQSQSAATASPRYAAAFDSAVTAIARTWVDTAFLSTRWLPAARAARDSAVSAPNDTVFRRVVQGLLERIPASHFYLLPAPDSTLARDGSSAAAPGRGGLTVRLTDISGAPQLVVAQVTPDGAAARAGVRAGDLVERIDGRALAPALTALPARGTPGATVARAQLVQGVQGLLSGATGEARVLDVVSAGGRASRRVILDAETRRLQQFGNLPAMPVEVSTQRVAVDDRRVAVVRFDAFFPGLMPAIDDALFAARSCSALVLDLRGNPGGLVGMIGGIAGHLLPSADTLGVMLMRESALRLVANPRTVRRDGTTSPVFGGPVFVLLDEASASASEILASALQGLGRARVVGTRSAGMALPAQLRRLATGDVLVHATADMLGPRGRRAEGEGVVPDIDAPLDPRRLAAGEDPALAAALAAVRGMPGVAKPGAECRP